DSELARTKPETHAHYGGACECERPSHGANRRLSPTTFPAAPAPHRNRRLRGDTLLCRNSTARKIARWAPSRDCLAHGLSIRLLPSKPSLNGVRLKFLIARIIQKSKYSCCWRSRTRTLDQVRISLCGD